jgi:acetyltransferase-like isoleucine patch superfamily enzyme
MDDRELLVAIKQLYLTRDRELKSRFQRSLPFQDAMFDRWERADSLGFAKGSSIYNSSLVFGEVLVGENSWIGPYTILDAGGGMIEIGRHCSISSGVHIYTHDTVHWALSGGVIDKRSAHVKIADNVYIGSQSIISLGVSIGEQSVVAANSFVNKDVAPQTIVGGSPARTIGRVEGTGKNVKILFE